ncbi:retention module-containing protein [Pseudomonas sp. NA-150]|uniref:retention module-containing protein n=1 Tax=Pseudomonas sp. NA-150 TaxID=3367525 RepID=UPI0037C5234E
MSSVVAIVKSIVGQVVAVSPEGVQRVLIEGDRLFLGDQVMTGPAGAVTLELQDGRHLDLGRDTQWSSNEPDVGQSATAAADASQSVAELQQAIAAGADPTKILEAPAAGPAVQGGGPAGGGHSFVLLDATAGRVDPAIGFPTGPIGSAAIAADQRTGGTNDGSEQLRASTLTLTATPTLTEAGGVLVYTATVTAAPLSPLIITLSNGQTITIAVGQTTGSVSVPLADHNNVYVNPSDISTTVTGIAGGGGTVVTIDPTPAVTHITDTIDNTGLTLTASNTVTEGGQIIYTATLTNAAQTAVTVTLSNGSVITIAAGQTTGTVHVDTPPNDVYKNGSTVSTTITGASGGNFEQLTPDTTPAKTTITDSIDTTNLTLSATPTVNEGGQITYTATLSNKAQTDVTVTLSGGQSLVIKAGSDTGSVTLDAPKDDVYKDAGTVSQHITGATGGNFENLVPSSDPAVTNVNDTIDKSTVTLSSDVATVAEGGVITYTATLSDKVTGAPVVITLANGQTITIPVGGTTGTATQSVTDDALKGHPDVVNSIKTVTGGNYENLVPDTSDVKTSVTDTPTTTNLTLSATDTVAEGGQITYTASVDNNTGTDLIVQLSGGQSITIKAGESSGSITVDAPKDDVYKDAGPVSQTITGTSGGNFENLVPSDKPAVTNVTDTITDSSVKLTANASTVAEGGTITYTATLSDKVTGSPVVITLANGQVITIPVGSSTGTTTEKVSNDAVIGHDDVINSIKTVTGGNYENLVPDTTPIATKVTDVLTHTGLSLTATPVAFEGGKIVYTATLTNAAGTDLTIKLDNGQSFVIKAGATSGSIILDAPKDDVYNDPSIVKASIQSTSGGNFEQLDVSHQPALTLVRDTIDPSSVKLTADVSVAEGSVVTYTATVSAPVTGFPLFIALANGQVIFIPIGGTTGTATQGVSNDALIGHADVTNSIKGVFGGNYENLIPDNSTVTTHVTDTQTTTHLTLSATAAVNEGGKITYTASVDNKTGTDLVVQLSGGQSITIKAGANSGSVTVDAPQDDVYKDAGKVSQTITGYTGGNFENVAASTTPAVTNVADTITNSSVKLTSDVATVAEGGTITYTATLSDKVTGSPVLITLANGQVITIPVGSSTGTTTEKVSNDAVIGHDDVINSIKTVTGGNYENLVPDTTPIATKVTDVLTHTGLSLTATPVAFEGGKIVYTATLTNAAGTDLTIKLDNGQSFVIKAGATSGSIILDAPKDDVYNDPSIVKASIQSTSGGNFEQLDVSHQPALTLVRDTIDPSSVKLTADVSVAEGGVVTYTATVSAPVTGFPLFIALANGQVIFIPIGGTTGTATQGVSNDALIGHADVTNSIKGVFGGNYENLIPDNSTVTTHVTDTQTTTHLTLSATAAVNEGGKITYTASVDNKTGTDMVVQLSGGQSITIKAGANSGFITVNAPSDDVYKDAGPVSQHITGYSGGNFENVAASTTPATTQVADTNDTTYISIKGSTSVTEGADAVYTLSLTNPAHAAVTVTVNYDNGAGFKGSMTVTIPNGASSFQFPIHMPDDALAGNDKNLVVTISNPAGGNYESIAVSPTGGTATTTVIDNDPPAAQGGTATGTEDTALTLTWAHFGITNLDPSAVGAGITLTHLPTNGTLEYQGKVLTATDIGTVISKAEIDAGHLVFTPAANESGVPANGGHAVGDQQADYAQIGFEPTLGNVVGNNATVTIDITPVADMPTLTIGGALAPATGMIKDTWTGLSGLGTDGNGTAPNLLQSIIGGTTATPDTHQTVTNVTAPDVAQGVASKTSGLIYMEAGHSYTFSGTGDDGLLVTVGGQQVAATTWGAGAQLNGTFTPTVSGYYTLDIFHYNQNGPGNYDVNLSVDGKPATDLSSAGVPLYTSTADLTHAGVQVGDLHGSNGEGYYQAYQINQGPENGSVAISPITTKLTDTDGSETLSVKVSGAPAGTVFSDAAGHHATADSHGNADISGLDTTTLSLKPPANYAGSFDLTVTSTATEHANGSQASASGVIPVTVFAPVVSEASISGTHSVNEGDTASYTVTLTQPSQTGTTINFSYSGTAANGTDFTGVASVKVPQGASSVDFNIATLADHILEGSENFTIKIDSITAGLNESVSPSHTAGSITTTIVDGDTGTVTLSAPQSVNEGGQVTYTISLSEKAQNPITVHLSDGHTVTIAANTQSVQYTLPAPVNDVYNNAPVTLAIKDASGPNGEHLSYSTTPVSTQITGNDDTTLISIKGAAASVTEGADATYTLSLTNPAHADVTVIVSYDNGAGLKDSITVTIPNGASGTQFSIHIPDDTLASNNKNLVVTLSSPAGGNYENIAVSPTAGSATTTVIDNDIPAARGQTVTGTEDTGLTLTWANFGVSNLDPNATGAGITLTQLPTNGTLAYQGKVLTASDIGTVISKTEIDAGHLVFTPAANVSSNPSGDAGLGNNHADLTQIGFEPTLGNVVGSNSTVTIDIKAVADVPTLHIGDTLPPATGLIKDTWTGLTGLGTDGSGAAPSLLLGIIGHTTATPDTHQTVTNVTDTNVPQGEASKTSGLIFMEAGHTYTFVGTADDSLLITVGGQQVAVATWGAGGQVNGSFTPTTSGYYTLDIFHYNQNGPGNYNVNLLIDGQYPSTIPVYTSTADLTAAGVHLGDLTGSNGEGYYQGYPLNEGPENGSVSLSHITTGLTDIDGSETLSVSIGKIPPGSVLTDASGHTFTATATSTNANVTGWDLNTLTIKPPAYYSGSFDLSVTSTATEHANGNQASSAGTIHVTVDPATYHTTVGGTGNDTLTTTDGNNIIVADAGLHVVQGQNYNIAFLVDTSGSMGTTAINAAKASLTAVFTSLLNSLQGANHGTVNIFLADFATQVNHTMTIDLSSAGALDKLKAALNLMSSSGTTNYEDAFKAASNFFDSSTATHNTNATNLTYFITDGQPNVHETGESFNPTVINYNTLADKALDSLITVDNYHMGDVFKMSLGGVDRVVIDAAGHVTQWTENSKGAWSGTTLAGTLHFQGDGTYELATNTQNGDVLTDTKAAFAALNSQSHVSAIGLNNGIVISDLSPYDTDHKPLTNINPADLANAILGHSAAGADNVTAGVGNDIIFGDVVIVPGSGAQGYDALQAFVGTQNHVDPSLVTTKDVHQYITEHAAAFDISGPNDGNDTLLGGAGNDILFGQGGNDNLDGGAGNDTLFGGAGNDILRGGMGDNTLIGGLGADTFVWKSGDTGHDVIKDFSAAQGDRIDLTDLLHNETAGTIDNFLKLTTASGRFRDAANQLRRQAQCGRRHRQRRCHNQA